MRRGREKDRVRKHSGVVIPCNIGEASSLIIGFGFPWFIRLLWFEKSLPTLFRGKLYKDPVRIVV